MIPESWTAEDAKQAYNLALDAALARGDRCPIGIGLSEDTTIAVDKVARAFPNATTALVRQADSAFAAEQH